MPLKRTPRAKEIARRTDKIDIRELFRYIVKENDDIDFSVEEMEATIMSTIKFLKEHGIELDFDFI